MPKNQSRSICNVTLQRIKDNDPTFTFLQVYNNTIDKDPLTDEKIKALSEALKNNQTIKSIYIIDVRGGKISYKSAKALSVALRSNNTLEQICLQDCLIGDEGAKAFSEALKFNQTLQIIRLSGHTGISSKGKQTLQNTLKNRIFNRSVTFETYDGNRYCVVDLAYDLQRRWRDQFTQVLIILGRESTKTASQSFWGKLPKELAFYIISLIKFNPLDTGKSPAQIIEYAKFIFNNIPQLNESLEESIKTQQEFKIIEKIDLKGNSRFRFFPPKSQQASPIEKPIELNRQFRK